MVPTSYPVSTRSMEEAVQGNKTEILNRFLTQNPGMIHARNTRGQTLLIQAVIAKADRCAAILMSQADCDLQAVDFSGKTAAHYAAASDQAGIFEALINKKASLIVIDKEQLTPLHIICINNALKVTEVVAKHIPLLKNSPPFKSGKTTPLHLAATAPKRILEVFRELVGNPNIFDHRGRNPLHYAATIKNKENTSFLALECEVNLLDADKQTPLSIACQKGHWAVAEELMAHEADPNLGLPKPLLQAYFKGHSGLVNLFLLSRKISIEEHLVGKEPLLALAKKIHDTKFVEMLTEAGAKDITPSAKRPVNGIKNRSFNKAYFRDKTYLVKVKGSHQGNTELHDLVLNGELDTLTILMQNILDLTDWQVKNDLGETPLHLVCRQGVQEKCEKMLNWGILPAVDSSGNTILFASLQSGNHSVFFYLASTFPDLIDVKNKELQAPLHFAIRWGLFPHVLALVKNGVDVNCIDNRGNTPLHLVSSLAAENPEMIRQMLDALTQRFADKEAVNDAGATPLHHALGEQNMIAFEHLLQLGADKTKLDADGKSLLEKACELQLHEAVKILIKYGVDRSALKHRKGNPLKIAIDKLDFTLAKLLLEGNQTEKTISRKAHPDLGVGDETPLISCIRKIRQANADRHSAEFQMLQILLQHGADPDRSIKEADSEKKLTPLRLAVVLNLTEVVIELLTNPYRKLNLLSKGNQKALKFACKNDRIPIIKELINQKMPINDKIKKDRTFSPEVKALLKTTQGDARSPSTKNLFRTVSEKIVDGAKSLSRQNSSTNIKGLDGTGRPNNLSRANSFTDIKSQNEGMIDMASISEVDSFDEASQSSLFFSMKSSMASSASSSTNTSGSATPLKGVAAAPPSQFFQQVSTKLNKIETSKKSKRSKKIVRDEKLMAKVKGFSRKDEFIETELRQKAVGGTCLLHKNATILAESLSRIGNSIKVTLNGQPVPEKDSSHLPQELISSHLIRCLLIELTSLYYPLELKFEEITKRTDLLKERHSVDAAELSKLTPYREGILNPDLKDMVPFYLLTKDSAALMIVPYYLHFTKKSGAKSKDPWAFYLGRRDQWETADFQTSNDTLIANLGTRLGFDIVDKSTNERTQSVAYLHLQAVYHISLQDGSIRIEAIRKISIPEDSTINDNQLKALLKMADCPLTYS